MIKRGPAYAASWRSQPRPSVQFCTLSSWALSRFHRWPSPEQPSPFGVVAMQSVLCNFVKVCIKWRTTWPAPIASPPPSSIRIARMMARWYAAPAEPSWRPSANTGNFWNNMRERRECKQLAVRNEALERHAAGVRRGSSRSVGPAGRQQNMFAIDWLRRGVPVDTETSVLTSEGAVIAGKHDHAH
jgi:hypothetical protein